MKRAKAPNATRAPWTKPSPQMMRLEELDALPVALTLEQAAWAVGICETTARSFFEAQGLLAEWGERTVRVPKNWVREWLLQAPGKPKAPALQARIETRCRRTSRRAAAAAARPPLRVVESGR